MARLVEDLLSLSRIEMNEHTPPTDTVPLPPLLANVQNTLAWRAEKRGVTPLDRYRRGPAARDRRRRTSSPKSSSTWSITRSSTETPMETVRIEARRAEEAQTAGWMAGQGRRDIGIRRRPGGRHSSGASAAAHGALLPRGQGALARAWRHGPWPCHRQAHREQTPRRAQRRQCTPGEGSTFTVHLQPAQR